MTRLAYLTVACDTDPDINPPYREPPGDHQDIWQGILVGLPALRRRLNELSFLSGYSQFPITWLLRSDRQIYELYQDAAFCFKRFEKTWRREQEQHGSEIGWHPHLYRWNERKEKWTEYLGEDEDIEILKHCLESLRRCIDISAVRTGWVYHSNRLMNFFDNEGLLVDVSAIPGTAQSKFWYHGRFLNCYHDWRGAPRMPFFPSKVDYRRRAKPDESSLSILEMPVIVRRLNVWLQLSRYGLHKLRMLRSNSVNYSDWGSLGYQGVLLSGKTRPFNEAVKQTLTAAIHHQTVLVNTYFHTDDLLSATLVENFMRNLESIFHLSEQMGWTVVPTTLSKAASIIKSEMISRQTVSGLVNVAESK